MSLSGVMASLSELCFSFSLVKIFVRWGSCWAGVLFTQSSKWRQMFQSRLVGTCGRCGGIGLFIISIFVTSKRHILYRYYGNFSVILQDS